MTAGVDIAAGDGVELSTQLTRRRAAGRGEMAAMSPLRIFFYIDALNLYYGALRNTPHRWLDIDAFCSNIIQGYVHINPEYSAECNVSITDSKTNLTAAFAGCQVVGIKVFTARVNQSHWDKDAPKRQKCYWDAIGAADPQKMIKIIYGSFISLPKNAYDVTAPHQKRRVIYTEEKGSDVNLALHMLNDAVDGLYDGAIMVSNDSDLLEALRLTRARGKLAGVVFPVSGKRRPGKSLKQASDFHFITDNKLLKASQLPDPVADGNKFYKKPPSWNKPKP